MMYFLKVLLRMPSKNDCVDDGDFLYYILYRGDTRQYKGKKECKMHKGIVCNLIFHKIKSPKRNCAVVMFEFCLCFPWWFINFFCLVQFCTNKHIYGYGTKL